MNEIIEEMSRVLKGKRVCLFWSGGYESTALLALLIGQKLYEGCDLHVVTVAFPQEIYEGKAVGEIGRRLRACGVDHIVLVPRESMGHDYPFDRACARCKQIRRAVICDHLKEYYGDGEVVYLTGHNLDDIASYTLELLAACFSGKECARARFLECANKFERSFAYSDNVHFYRPFCALTRAQIGAMTDGEGFAFFDRLVKKDCYWLRQRKRLLQEYLVSAGIELSYEGVRRVFDANYARPSAQEYRELSFDTYFM